MHRHCYLPCLRPDCEGRTLLPVPTQEDAFLRRKPWPSGVKRQAFLCQTCMRTSVYTRLSPLLDHPQIPGGPCICMETEIYLLSFPCEVEACTGRLLIRAAVPLKTALQSCGIFANRGIVATNLLCTKRIHSHNEIVQCSPLARFGQDSKWSALQDGKFLQTPRS
jgi:hypothetical protein